LRVVSLGRYWTAAGARSPVADLLCRFKYDGDRAAGHALAAMTARRTAAMAPTAPLVVPVPLTRSRMRVRGFNQAAWLAWPLSRRPATRLQAEALQRTRQAHSQVGLSAHSRTRRIGGDFRARRRTVAGARVLLVDDVLTTGATLLACDAALRAAGAAEVCALTLLASPRPAR
jgi:ComF family protein